MFFSGKMISIRPRDRVLEIGPGSDPHPRSNAFLELNFDYSQDKIAQRGGGLIEADFGDKPVYYYDGNIFPFEDGQFDYVVCSHVIEHVVDPVTFINELIRVGGGRGYIEYPLITYEYLYNFNVHLNFIKFDSARRVLNFLPKCETPLASFSGVNSLFYESLKLGWDDLCAANKELFFEGLEFISPFVVEKNSDLDSFLPAAATITEKRPLRRFLGRVMNKLEL